MLSECLLSLAPLPKEGRGGGVIKGRNWVKVKGNVPREVGKLGETAGEDEGGGWGGE